MANNQLLASDSFTGGSLAAGWSAISGLSKCQVVTGTPNVTEGNVVGTAAGQIWTGSLLVGSSWPNDQISEVTLGAALSVTSATVGLVVRYLSSAQTGYIAVFNGSGTLYVYADTNGTLTQISSGVTGLTFASGDVLTFQVAGCCLTVYQNGKLIFYFYDTTYTSGGYAGYDQNPASTLGSSQVSSWRGYSCVQQDGVWTKQGIVIPAIATDLTQATAGVGIQICGVLYGGNAQILSGNVYKTWIVSDWSNDAASAMYYAESLDGISWTRKSTAVLASVTNGYVFKNGSTYYLYGQASGSSGSGNMVVYTSSDGINWTQQTPTSVLGAGGSGAWDYHGFYNIATLAISGGTWYGYYIAQSASGQPFATGLATSTDGINWTKYASNPVITGVVSGSSTGSAIRNALAQVGSKWYMWCTSNHPGQDATALDPFECVRYVSSDLENWSLSAHSLHHSQAYESLNALTGGLIPAAILDVNGKAYMWCDSSVGDSTAPQIGQVSLAVGPAPIASIITQNEDAMTQIASDSFTGGSLSGNWTSPTYSGSHAVQVVSGNLAEPSATSQVCIAVRTGETYSSNQYSEATLHTATTANDSIYVIARASLSALTFYQFSVSHLGTQASAGLVKWLNGSSKALGVAGYTFTPQVGDVFRLSVVTGSDGFPVLSVYQNGFLLYEVQDYVSPITSGAPGFYFYATDAIAQSQISKWAGGNANVVPTYPVGGRNRTRALKFRARGLVHHEVH
jgi:hypothetical protein